MFFFSEPDLLTLPWTLSISQGNLGNNRLCITFRTLKSIVQKGRSLCSVSSTSSCSEAWLGLCVKKPVTLPGALLQAIN